MSDVDDLPVDPEQFWERPDFDEPVTPPVDAFQADRWSRWLKREHEKLAEADARYKAQREDLDRWYDALTGPSLRRIKWLTESLTAWHRACLEADPKAPKTLELPGAVLRSTAGRESVVVDEPEVFVKWALAERPDLLRHQPDLPSIKALPRHPEDPELLVNPETGERVDGVVVAVGERSYSVKVRES